MKTRVLFVLAVLAAGLFGCRPSGAPSDFTAGELEMIRSVAAACDSTIPAGTMRVLTIEDEADLEVLRSSSADISAVSLRSTDYASLCSLMIATVTHPSQDGVGIAGPQVGLNRRVVAVQRFDKSGEPFEVYPNIRIVWASDSTATGPEGCLSVPDRRGNVIRSREIVIEYASLPTKTDASRSAKDDGLKMVRDTIRDFTAVIFQHEIDHLDGILYIDRL